jgi:hypothetical protein
VVQSLLGLYRRLRYGKPVIVVSGLPRSGTSMAMRMLEAGGVPIVTDELRGADEDNPHGYFELESVKDLDKKGEDPVWLSQAHGKAVKIVSALLEHLPATHNYKVLFMHRDLQEVLASQSKMLTHRGEDSEATDRQLRQAYESHLRKVRVLLRLRPQFDAAEISYADVVANPRREAERIGRFLGDRLDVRRMAEAVDENLYRNRFSR